MPKWEHLRRVEFFFQNSRSGVERHPVVPDGDVVLSPFVTHLEIVVLGDLAVEVVEKVVGLLGVEFQDSLREPVTGVQKEIVQRTDGYTQIYRSDTHPLLTKRDLYPVRGCVRMTGLQVTLSRGGPKKEDD